MKKPLILNDNYIDVDKVSFIGKVDTIVKAHIGVQYYYFTTVVEGNEVKIEADKKDEALLLRNRLIAECGASIPQELIGLMPS